MTREIVPIPRGEPGEASFEKLSGTIARAAARALNKRKSKPKMIARVVFVGENRGGEPLPPSKAIPGSNVVIEYAYGDEPASSETAS